MKKPIYLFDASSIVRALKKTKLVLLCGQALQWLIIYEVINVLWKEVYLLRKFGASEAALLLDIFTNVALASKHNLILVTEDQRLSHMVRDIVNVVSLDSLT